MFYSLFGSLLCKTYLLALAGHIYKLLNRAMNYPDKCNFLLDQNGAMLLLYKFFVIFLHN